MTSSECCSQPCTNQPGNWGWITVIQAKYADSWTVPSCFAVKGKSYHFLWYQDSRFQHKWRGYTSENGWTINEIGLDWLIHFDQTIKHHTRGYISCLSSVVLQANKTWSKRLKSPKAPSAANYLIEAQLSYMWNQTLIKV